MSEQIGLGQSHDEECEDHNIILRLLPAQLQQHIHLITTSRFVQHEKLSLHFSSSTFAIRLNLLHPRPSLFLFGFLLPVWCFSTLINNYF